MHIHMRPSELQHTQASQPTKRTTKTNQSESDAISELQDRSQNPRRERQDQRNGGGRPSKDGLKSFVAALTAFDLSGAETASPPPPDQTSALPIADLLAAMKR